jgi:L-lactate dehydrogenase (cytochrome)
VDGGINRGTDVVKALCLGANAVGVGRGFLYAQSVAGTEGVKHAVGSESNFVVVKTWRRD